MCEAVSVQSATRPTRQNILCEQLELRTSTFGFFAFSSGFPHASSSFPSLLQPATKPRQHRHTAHNSLFSRAATCNTIATLVCSAGIYRNRNAQMRQRCDLKHLSALPVPHTATAHSFNQMAMRQSPLRCSLRRCLCLCLVSGSAVASVLRSCAVPSRPPR